MVHPPLRRRARLSALAPAIVLALACATGGPGGAAAPATLPVLDSARLVQDVFRLAHDSMAGRAAMTPENAKARDWLESEFRRIGLEPVGGSFRHPFAAPRRNGADTVRGVNLIGLVRGVREPERVIVVGAHYDHVGTRNGQVHNGADDNASGTATLLALAAHLTAHPPAHTILLALWDAEEMGLVGARAFVAAPPIARERIALNVNLDMVSRSDKDELYAAGAARYPQVRPILEAFVPVAAVTLKLGHDSGGGQDDWTTQSDHGAFHAAGIPFVYFGVEDHPDYHKPTDDPERIPLGFFYRSARTIAGFVVHLDREISRWPAPGR